MAHPEKTIQTFPHASNRLFRYKYLTKHNRNMLMTGVVPTIKILFYFSLTLARSQTVQSVIFNISLLTSGTVERPDNVLGS